MCSGWNGYRKYMNGFIDYTKRILCGVLCLMLLLSGCGGQKEVDIFDKDQLDIPVADELPLTGEELMAPGRLLRMNLPDFKTLHPLQAMNEATANVFSLIFDPAVRIEQDGSCTPNVLEGWEYDSETRIYTFHIRKNVAFHDETYGTADADDLLYAIKYNIEHENAAMHHYTEGILAYTKTDELTFTVQVEQPKHNLLLLFGFYVVPKEYYASRGPNTSVIPVGTGAYKVSGYTEGERMILTRHEGWWKTLPIYSSIELTPADPSRIALGSDIYEEYELLFTESITAGSLGVAGKTEVNQIKTPYLSCLIPNVYNRIMEDGNIRKAIAYGIDRTELISSALMGLGEATVTPLSDNYWAVNCDNHGTVTQNKQKALDYLEKAGYRRGEDGRQYQINSDGTKSYLSIRLLYSGVNDGYNVNRMVAQVIRKELGEIGITVVPVEKIGEDYLTALEEGTFQLALCQFYTYQDNDISFLLEEPYNYGNFYSTELSKAMQTCKTAAETETAIAAYSALQEMLLEKMPVIGLYYQEHCLLSEADIVIPAKLQFKQIFSGINSWSDKG